MQFACMHGIPVWTIHEFETSPVTSSSVMPMCTTNSHIARVFFWAPFLYGWADSNIFTIDKYSMPKEGALRDLTKEHWDPLLNPDYVCPNVIFLFLSHLLALAHSGIISTGSVVQHPEAIHMIQPIPLVLRNF